MALTTDNLFLCAILFIFALFIAALEYLNNLWSEKKIIWRVYFAEWMTTASRSRAYYLNQLRNNNNSDSKEIINVDYYWKHKTTEETEEKKMLSNDQYTGYLYSEWNQNCGVSNPGKSASNIIIYFRDPSILMEEARKLASEWRQYIQQQNQDVKEEDVRVIIPEYMNYFKQQQCFEPPSYKSMFQNALDSVRATSLNVHSENPLKVFIVGDDRGCFFASYVFSHGMFSEETRLQLLLRRPVSFYTPESEYELGYFNENMFSEGKYEIFSSLKELTYEKRKAEKHFFFDDYNEHSVNHCNFIKKNVYTDANISIFSSSLLTLKK